MIKTILDPCCGSRMFWFDKKHPAVIFGDIRTEQKSLCDGRTLTVSPDVTLDFRDLPYADGAFKLVSFDPPHLVRAGAESWMKAKYGVLNPNTWQEDLRRGFSECWPQTAYWFSSGTKRRSAPAKFYRLPTSSPCSGTQAARKVARTGLFS